jgi:hypothetical protein
MSLITANQIAARFAAIEQRLAALEAAQTPTAPAPDIDDRPTDKPKPAKRKRR